MADAIKSVVVEIETKLQGNAIDNLNKGLRTADSLSEELARQIQVVDKAIQSTNAKRLKINGTDTSKKELQELSNALKLAAQDFDQLSDIQKNTLAALLKENAKVVESLENTAQASDGAKQGAEGYLRAINVLTPLLGQHGVAISLVVSNYLEYAEAAKRGEASSSQLGGVLSLLQNKYVALAAAVTAFVGVGLNEYFGKTDEGADKLDQTLTGLRESFKSFTGGIANLGGAIFNFVTGDRQKALESLNDSISNFGEVVGGDAFDRGVNFSKLLDEIEDKAANLALTTADLEVEFFKLREVLSEEIITVDDAQNALNALEELNKVSKELAQSQLALKKAELEVAIQRAANFSQADTLTKESIQQAIATKNLSAITGEYRGQIISAYEALRNIEIQEANRERQLNRQGKSIKRIADGLGKDFVDAISNLDKAFAESEINIGKFLRQDIKPEDLNKAKAEVAKIVTELTAQFDTLIKQGEKIAPGLFTGTELERALRAEQLNIPIEFIDELNQRFSFVGEQAANVFALSFKEGLLPAFGQKEIQLDLPPIKPVQKKGKGLLEELFSSEESKRLLEQAQADIFSAFNTFIETEIQKTDFLIQEQQRRIDETNRLAAFGNAEQLQLEQERLNKLLEERRKFEQAQQAINAAAAISATAASAANFTLALTKDAATLTPVLAIANSIALVAAIAAGIAQISSLAQGFEKGTEYLTPGQKSNKGKTDTIPAWLAPGERVVPAMINEQLKGIKNADLPKLVAAGKMALEGYGQLNTSITSNSYGFTSEAVGILKDLKQGIAEIPRALSDQIVDINFDHYGYVIQQRRVSRHAQKVKALTR